MSEKQIDEIVKKDKDKAGDSGRPTYTKMSRRHLSIETLNRYRIDYEFDVVRMIGLVIFQQALMKFRIRTMS
jgi:hypothetical protein